MIVTRTPLRVSFFGGGTDYPDYFKKHRGAVVGMAINKYIYISAIPITNIIDHKWRLAYSKLEWANSIDEIEHPVIRESLRFYDIKPSWDFSIQPDLPARTGLGSSSAFTVGFLNFIREHKKFIWTTNELTLNAIRIERDILHENVGVQDQHHAAYGGINRFDFQDGRTRITPLNMTSQNLQMLNNCLFLVYTGMSRHASEVLNEQMELTKTGKIEKQLNHLLDLVDQACEILESQDNYSMIDQFGELLHNGWETKKQLSSKVSNNDIDQLYDLCMQNGAIGGKLCGAGSGGFLLMVVPPENKERFMLGISSNVVIPINMDTQGSKVISNL